MNTFARSFAGALSMLALAASSNAGYLGMPEGARQYIELSASKADPGTCPGVNNPQGGDAVNGVGSIPSPSPDYTIACWEPSTVYALASSTPNNLRSATWNSQGSAVFLYNSMVDTYTIAGPPGSDGQPVQFTVRVHVTGTMSIGFYCCGNIHFGLTQLQLEIGIWNPNPAPNLNEQFRVDPFNSGEVIQQGIPSGNYGATPPVVDINYDQTATLTRTEGQPFDIAFGLQANGLNPIFGWAGNGSPPSDEQMINASIDFELPPGYTITSLRGWTDPSVPPPCTGDADGDNVVNFADVISTLANFGGTGPAGDADHNGAVNFADVISVLANFLGPCA